MLCLCTLHIYTNRITAKASTNGALQVVLEQSQASEAIAKTETAEAITAVADSDTRMLAMEQDHADQTAAAVEAAVTAALANSSHNADIAAERRCVRCTSSTCTYTHLKFSKLDFKLSVSDSSCSMHVDSCHISCMYTCQLHS
jgi:Eukaryotic aspartyl protease